ncbi:glycosyltransferase family 2 protein [Lacrimispora sp.]|uniref:glycosyltransferase family 2 protein n=1 Tax=Lacrimispora sp. TaxID=2719234 RepID=UPI0028A5F789|nr:glycosyltransferase family 2 protein [Lacrimispora sp.]
MKPSVRLSQCMIVKDEEKNIRQALSWGKGIVYEQIVIDTGSTDKTVEIAEEMGAKVFCFPWTHDFSAAKNFAIEKARGNWIAFLDADEYFSDEDVKKILPLLKQLEKKFYPAHRPHLIRSLLVNLGDGGKTIGTGVQDRIFRNIPNLRYHNRVHEYLDVTDGGQLYSYDATGELAVFHTGYAPSVVEERGKEERNIFMIQKELEEEPDSVQMWRYLGDSFLLAHRYEEAEEAYLHGIENPALFEDVIHQDPGFASLLKVKFGRNADSDEGFLAIYQKAKNCGCASPDVDYWAGEWLYRNGNESGAIQYFEQSLQLMEGYDSNDPLALSGRLFAVYQKIFSFYAKQNRPVEMIRYGVLLLRLEPYHAGVLKEILILLKQEPGEEETANATFAFLSKFYDLSTFKNKLYLIKVSRQANFPALEKNMEPLLTEEEREFVAGAGDIF